MVAIQQVKKQEITINPVFVKKGEALNPVLKKSKIYPLHLVKVVDNPFMIHGWEVQKIESAKHLPQYDYGKGDSFIVDFGDHEVGYIKLNIRPVGSPPDAPLHFKLTFAEMPVELAEPFSEYNGWISSSWLQEEVLHVDVLPDIIELPRRYSFRYIKFEILDTSQKYTVAFDTIECTTVTSADTSIAQVLESADPVIQKIDKVSMKTLQDCMQEVFEDGPKRDRRLWLGDLRLQALANYETFKNFDLVKRCLYLFAGTPDDKGLVSANLFIMPKLIPDDTYLTDYSLLFTVSLYDYYEATKDLDTLKELWPTAFRQVELALERLDNHKIFKEDESWWSFIDWTENLDKQAPTQGVLIYTIKRAIQLAEVLGNEQKTFLEEQLQAVTEAVLQYLWDADLGFFVSGADKQVSWASQIWMALAEVLKPEENRKLMLNLLDKKPKINLTTPYMQHYLVDALYLVGEKEKAKAHLLNYWGNMIDDGADTFWELYDPDNKSFSPYGSYLINSYCHAWSCTPTYFIRKYHLG